MGIKLSLHNAGIIASSFALLSSLALVSPHLAKAGDGELSKWQTEFEKSRVDFYKGKYSQARTDLLNLLEKSKSESVAPSIKTRLLCLIANSYYQEGMLTRAQPYFNSALTIPLNAQEEADLNLVLAQTQTRLGVIKYSQSNYAEAEKLHKAALSRLSDNRQPNYELLGHIYRNLADSLYAQQKFEPAHQAYLVELNIAQRECPNDKLNLAVVCQQLGYLEMQKRDYQAAEKFLRRTSTILEASDVGDAQLRISNMELLEFTLKALSRNAEAKKLNNTLQSINI
jgi:tetratricopeptide (TPR) repeat protein